MKKLICLCLCAVMLFALAACGENKPEGSGESSAASGSGAEAESGAPEAASAGAGEAADGWVTEGFFQDEEGHMLSVFWMSGSVEQGWYVGCMIGEDMMKDSYGGVLPQEGNTLHGELPSSGGKDPVTVTVSLESDGVQLAVEGGKSFHLKPAEMPVASINVTVGTEGFGYIEYAEGETVPQINKDFPYQSARINLVDPATYTFLAWPQEGNVFVKWTKDGEDLSTEPQVTILLEESTELTAVFGEDPDWQNPVMNFVGEYQCDGAHATVECSGNEDALIIIEWGGSATETARWDIVGRLDTETLTIEYTGSTKSIIVYDESGEIKSREAEYEDGTGTIFFGDDGTFTWHDDKAENGTDMVFTWADGT